MTARLSACVLALALCGCERLSPALTETEVQEFVRQYVAASNGFDAGKVMGFIQKDEAVSSVGLGTIYRGWNAISTATDRAFTEEVRIKLTVGTLDVARLGNDTAIAVASMSVTSTQPIQIGRAWMTDAPGAMTIVVRRTPDGLRVIHEHYSLRPV